MARYTPGLDWLLPGNWLTGAPIKNLYDQAVKDHKWRIAYNDLEKDFPSDGRNRPPGTNERLRAKLKELKGGEPSSVKADTTVLKEENKLLNKKTIASTNARASLMNAARGQAAGKGSIGKNLLTLQEMHKEQNPAAQASATTTTNVESVQTQSQTPTTTNNTNTKVEPVNKTVPNPIPTLEQMSTSGRGAGRRAFLTPEYAKLQDAAVAETLNPLKNAINNLTSKADGKVTAQQRMQGAGKAMAGAIAQEILAKIAEPKKGTEGANRSQGAITGSGNSWEEFYAPSFYNV